MTSAEKLNRFGIRPDDIQLVTSRRAITEMWIGFVDLGGHKHVCMQGTLFTCTGVIGELRRLQENIEGEGTN